MVRFDILRKICIIKANLLRGAFMEKTLNIVIDADGPVYDFETFVKKYAVSYFKDKYNLEVVNENGYGIREIFNCTEEQEEEFWIKDKYAIK